MVSGPAAVCTVLVKLLAATIGADGIALSALELDTDMCTTFSCSACHCSNQQNGAATVSYYCESQGYSESVRSGGVRGFLAALVLTSLIGCSPANEAAPGTVSDTASDIAGSVSTIASSTPIETEPVALGTTADEISTPKQTETAPNSSSAGLKVLVFGDSISAAYGIKRNDGWVALLADRIESLYADAKVINASVSGETTQGGRARLGAALQLHAPDVVFLELGGNDALRGYPVEKLRNNLSAMVELAQNRGAKVVLLGMQIPPNYGPHYTSDFAAAFKTVADARDAYLVPFFLEGVALIEGMSQSDGIHPTTKAQPLLLETGWQALVETMGDAYPLLQSP